MPAISDVASLPDCYRSQAECVSTIEPGHIQAGQLYLREFGGAEAFELILPPILLAGGEVVEPSPLRFTQVVD